MLATHAFFFWSVRSRIAKGDPDFTVFYTAGKIVREGLGHKLYNSATQKTVQQEFATDTDIRRGPLPYIHPPFEALVFLPLTFLPYPIAFVAWNGINLCLLLLVAWVLRNWLSSLRQMRLWQLVVLSLAFFPIFANFHQGQDAILLLLLVVCGVRALAREVDFTAGCWFGIAVFKYHLILPLVLLLVIWKGWRVLGGFAVSASSAVLISVGIVGWHGALQYPVYAWRIVSQPAFGGIPVRQLPNLLGLIGGWPLLERIGWPVQLAVLACTLLLLATMARVKRAAGDPRLLKLCCACAVITAVLSGYSTNSYDLSLLILPLALLTDYCANKNPAAWRNLIGPAIPLLISPLWFFLWMGWERLNLMAVFLVWWLLAIRGEILRVTENTEEARLEGSPA